MAGTYGGTDELSYHITLQSSLMSWCMQVGQDTQRREESNSIWEAQCTLTLWLAQLVLIPFDLASVDSSISASATRSPLLLESVLVPQASHLVQSLCGRMWAKGIYSVVLCEHDCDTADLPLAHCCLCNHVHPHTLKQLLGCCKSAMPQLH